MSGVVAAVSRFGAWAETFRRLERGGEGECEYDYWHEIYAAISQLLDRAAPRTWSEDEWRDVLYTIARDNEDEAVLDDLVERHPVTILVITERARAEGEQDARWQLAVALGRIAHAGDDAERLLLQFARDDGAGTAPPGGSGGARR